MTIALPVTVSIGVAALHPHEAVEAVIKRADQALYAAKRGGRDQVVVLESVRVLPAFGRLPMTPTWQPRDLPQLRCATQSTIFFASAVPSSSGWTTLRRRSNTGCRKTAPRMIATPR
ncbi:sensor protein [Xanthomonas bromi]|uniref:diguanylate cyclase n=1 Tax=Xanthomonas bromi TaxID=56449 RepID=A0A1C3NL22_9XANT|nr:sensor protein [Xanthomonas bromi]